MWEAGEKKNAPGIEKTKEGGCRDARQSDASC